MIFMDTEFNRTTYPKVNPICATTHRELGKDNFETIDWWVFDNKHKQKELRDYVMDYREEVFNAWAVTAEARFLLSVGVDPLLLKWIDQFIEYRHLTNQNDDLCYGDQLVDGKIKKTKRPPPKWERTEQDEKQSFKPTHSLAEGTFKLTGEIRDLEQKERIRQLIISDPDWFSDEEIIETMKYCNMDTIFLPRTWDRMKKEYDQMGCPPDRDFLNTCYIRGEYSALIAKMESWGYPIDYQKTKNFSAAVGPVLEECQREVNQLFPKIKPFYYNKKENRFSMNQNNIKNWLIENVETKAWIKTDGFKKAKRNQRISGGEVKHEDYLSLSLKAFEKKFDFKHDYPKDNFGAQMVRYLKLKQSISAFIPSDKKNFWDAVGPDLRVRPYLNPYGSVSSRNQPGSTSFLFLKPAWMRALCAPEKGKCIGSFDYSSEEFLISALISGCGPMVEAYQTGDVYLGFAKLSGMVPQDATKKTHKKERNLAKSLVLGMSYQMTAKGLADKLTVDTGTKYTEEEAQGYINEFYSTFHDLARWQKRNLETYYKNSSLSLDDGWTMWGDNDNERSINNVPIQGMGACILRKAIKIAVMKYDLRVIIPLHDAIYIEYDYGDWAAMDKLYAAMREAFIYYFSEDTETKKWAESIRLDGFSWGPDFPAPVVDKDGEEQYFSFTTPGGMEIEASDIYVDERAKDEYLQFSKYFNHRAEMEL